jgi:hypothetical protein
MKVFVSLDLPYDRYLPQWSVTFHYKRRRRLRRRRGAAGAPRGGRPAARRSCSSPCRCPFWVPLRSTFWRVSAPRVCQRSRQQQPRRLRRQEARRWTASIAWEMTRSRSQASQKANFAALIRWPAKFSRGRNTATGCMYRPNMTRPPRQCASSAAMPLASLPCRFLPLTIIISCIAASC